MPEVIAKPMVVVINTGSSSIKMALIDMPTENCLAVGMLERMGEPEASISWKLGDQSQQIKCNASTHQAAMQQMFDVLFEKVDKSTVSAVGHRVVHGGERFIAPTELNPTVIADIEAISHLAPLHNPSNVAGIRAAMHEMPGIAHIAVFDTAFHHAMPLHASLYAVPYHWYSEYGARRYGFHGTSHHYVALQAAAILGRRFEDCRLLTAHLGNGCSATAIAGGMSVDTTMGMTPLEGLVMGTRSGDVDPGLHNFIAKQSKSTLEEVTSALNRQSGLLGISGRSNDMRVLLQASEAGDEQATLAIEMFCYRLAKSLAALTVALGEVDAIVFTGGIGEHASAIRAKTLRQLKFIGATVDDEKNRQHGRLSQHQISQSAALLPVFVIPTNEEVMIARYVCEVISTKDQTP